ncbi:MAG: phosphoenolpyruvate carboxylase [Pseudomonadota bacterium]
MTDFDAESGVKSAFRAPETAIDWCAARLADVAGAAKSDPLSNPVRRLAFDLSDAMERSDISIDAVRSLVKLISDDAAAARASAFREAHLQARDDMDALVEDAFHGLKGAGPQAFERAFGRTRAGVVFTAHPTFANPLVMRDDIAAFASDATASPEGLKRALAGRAHRADPPVTLTDEHAEALQRLESARASLKKLLQAMVRFARRERPEIWRRLVPAPISLATWIGYDLDGRTDIHWGETFRIRLEEKALRLRYYADELKPFAGAPACGALIDRFARAGELAARQAAAFAGDLDDPAHVVEASNLLTTNYPERMTSLGPAIKTLSDAIDASDGETAEALATLRSEMTLYGLGVARIHLRVNAAQVRSTLQSDLGVSPDGGFIDRTALSAAAEKAVSAEARNVNFGSVFRERMTARRQLMLCAQMLKHVDADSPIRFLIAESEAPATIMGAVYLARLYGVADKVDVSPLFETPAAIESGGRFMERLFREEEFVAYVRRRGRVAIQLGFSDSGRFMGQVPANLAIERLQILLSREMARAELTDVEAVVFNTHGESMGRGGYPGTLSERFDHLFTPWARARFQKDGVAANAEASFQGGDGFLHFQTQTLSDRTVAGLFAWAFEDDEGEMDDRFYEDINFSWDVYRAMKRWQEDLFEDASYQTALGAFALNFLHKTGSRKTRRQSGASMRDAARSLRAIPHNAILQQLAAPANVGGGFGDAAAREPERFAALVEGSSRFERIFRLGARARSLTSLSVLRAYADVYDPSFWTVRARHAAASGLAEACGVAAEALGGLGVESALRRLANHLSTDRRGFDSIAIGSHSKDQFPSPLYMLHAARIALIMRALLLTASAPSFSDRHEVSKADLMEKAARLELAETAALLARIFPREGEQADAFAGLNEPAHDDGGEAGYPEVHAKIVAPLLEIDAAIKDISCGVAHYYGAYG